MSSTLKTRKLEQRLLTLSLRGLFSQEFASLLYSKQPLTLNNFREPYVWLDDHTIDAVYPSDIVQLIKCRWMTDQMFSRNQQLPYEIVRESHNLGHHLCRCYDHRVQNTDWVFQLGSLMIGRKVNKFATETNRI